MPAPLKRRKRPTSPDSTRRYTRQIISPARGKLEPLKATGETGRRRTGHKITAAGTQ